MRNCEIRLALSAGEIQMALRLRREVFVAEQGMFEQSDADDHDSSSLFLNAWRSGSILMGTVRCYSDPHEEGIWWGGRLAVVEKYRLRGVGVYLIEAAVEEMKRRGAKRFFAKVQKQNVKLFEKLGWQASGDAFMIEEHPHQLMEADLHVHDEQARKRRLPVRN
ncbi:MSMEG_0567/Sll0786 family nitrogen starvation N-acetyltransferase [Paenibacillus sp. Soil522]|uniref:MSMEG_0567/Sll0786 family nitrogen starvation N-acetyltransferase n=1 Tax=Paenibacillus sp. Soil522 TaxID=1736388 RepID=UPI0006FF6763|nr:MSMEG_0567/Sll0786 family nitrogen starvation N-acetyltransferase [Paenibacillus sp. Soil522]KRE49285.1 acetyltransferase [Paenibacillus sp. Soil522]